jgi:hypothetical protein
MIGERREMTDLQVWKQRHEEMMREAQQGRLAKELRESRKGRSVGLAAVALLLFGTLGITTAFGMLLLLLLYVQELGAGKPHRFEDFTDDFGTWVIFYGPEGGERPH